MSTDTEFRFPTIPGSEGPYNGGIPILPEQPVFETIEIQHPEGGFSDHVSVEQIMARPSWDIEEAKGRVLGQMLDDGWAPHPYGMLVPPEQPKDRTKNRPTPKRKTGGGTRFQQGSEGGCYS